MIRKSFILPFVVLINPALAQFANAEIQIVRSEISATVAKPAAINIPTPNLNANAAPQVIQASYSQQSNQSSLQPRIQNQLKGSDSSHEFDAPTYATNFSAANASTFNARIPQYSAQSKLRNPPPYVACFDSSARKYGVPVDLLMAIAQTESSFRAGIKGELGHGADHGLMQINDYWVPKLRKRFNITLSDIYEPCTNIEIASWILAHNFVQFGYSWRAVGAYNAVTEWKRVRYINKVSANLKRLHAGQL